MTLEILNNDRAAWAQKKNKSVGRKPGTPKDVPKWIRALPPHAMLNAHDVYAWFGYASATSFSSSVYKGRFPPPDANSHSFVGGSKFFWRKETLLAEWHRRCAVAQTKKD